MSRSLLSRLRPQFSLRMLLFGMTGLSILFALGYVWWPTVERSQVTKAPSGWDHGRNVKEWRTVHREYVDFKGNRVKHGPLRVYDMNGKLLLEESWRHGKLHGPWRLQARPEWITTGSYLAGEKHGVWSQQNATGSYRMEAEYDRGQRLGQMFYNAPDFPNLESGRFLWLDLRYRGGERSSAFSYRPDGRKRAEIAFRNQMIDGPAHGWFPNGAKAYEGQWKENQPVGKWTFSRPDGTPAKTLDSDEPRFARLAAVFGGRDSTLMAKLDADWLRVAPELLHGPPPQHPNERSGGVRWLEATQTMQSHFVFDRQAIDEAGLNRERPIAFDIAETPVALAILALVDDWQLELARRRKMVIITTRERADRWRKRPAMDESTPVGSHHVRAQLLGPTKAEFLDEPLSGVLEFWQDYHRVQFVANTETLYFGSPGLEKHVTISALDMPFSDMLDFVLDQHGLAWHEEHGTLVLERQSRLGDWRLDKPDARYSLSGRRAFVSAAPLPP